MGLREKVQGYAGRSDSAEAYADPQQSDQMRVRRQMKPFRAEFIVGQLVLITEESFKILVENGAQTLQHEFNYESLEKLAEQFLGETVAFVLVNGRITKVKPF